MINRRKRRDANHQAIREAFERYGWRVLDTSQLGAGAPDLMVSSGGRTVAVEVKVKRAKLKPHQADWLAQWQGETAVIRDVDEVFAFAKAAALSRNTWAALNAE